MITELVATLLFLMLTLFILCSRRPMNFTFNGKEVNNSQTAEGKTMARSREKGKRIKAFI